MSGFSDAWLTLREPIDTAARAQRLVDALAHHLPARPIQITDLASGTGANLRYLCPRLAGEQIWCLVDDDDALLEALPARLGDWAQGHSATLREIDDALVLNGRNCECLIHRLNLNLATGLDALDLPANSLVTASALLDLVSAGWLDALAARCAHVRALVLLALSYDGRMELFPTEPEDATVTVLVNRHQQTDKGFGAALGPTSAARAADSFGHYGYAVDCARSDWQLGPGELALQAALLEGWLAAACEIEPESSATLEDWAARRRAHIAAESSTMRIGHVDLYARLP